MQNKHVIHLPSLLLLCLMLSYHRLPNLPPWVDCLHNFWFVSDCSGTTASFLSAKLLLFGSIVTPITRTRSESFLLLCQDLETRLLVLWAFLTQANAILDLRTPRIKPPSLGRGRFSKIISNSLNHHGSRKRYRFPLSERIYRLEARTQKKTPNLFSPLLHQYFRKQS